jgi:hypothetical protein
MGLDTVYHSRIETIYRGGKGEDYLLILSQHFIGAYDHFIEGGI